MAGYNRVVLIGNLTRDPDYKQIPSGQAVCRLGLATNRQFKNKQSGAMVQEVCYIDIDVWGTQAESCRQYLQKGRPVLIEGRLKYDTWEDQNGGTRSRHSIVADRVVFLGSGPQSEVDAEDAVPARIEPQSELEKGLLSQIDEIKNRGAAVRAAKKVVEQGSHAPEERKNAGEINFKDEPPFEDELPF